MCKSRCWLSFVLFVISFFLPGVDFNISCAGIANIPLYVYPLRRPTYICVFIHTNKYTHTHIYT